VEASEPDLIGIVHRTYPAPVDDLRSQKPAERLCVNPIGVASPPLDKDSEEQANPKRGDHRPAMGRDRLMRLADTFGEDNGSAT
jgi:hypothetical protein